MNTRLTKLLMSLLTALLTGLLTGALVACGGGKSAEFDIYSNEPIEPGNPLTPPTGPVGGTSGPSTPPPPSQPTPPGRTTTQPIVPKLTPPPIGLTWHVGLAENESKAQMQAVYSTLLGVNSALWNLTEGQVYIYKFVISDNVAPGTTPSQWEANQALFDTSKLDVVIWQPKSWDIPGTAGVVWRAVGTGFGRAGRLMLVPSDASADTLNHEASHLIWNLSWAGWTLDDEYVDGVQDVACLMESSASPVRWCASSNHVAQSSQPHSCWTQLLSDYTGFSHTGTDKASTSAWVSLVTYIDTP